MLTEMDKQVVRLGVYIGTLELMVTQKDQELSDQKQFYENQIEEYKKQLIKCYDTIKSMEI